MFLDELELREKKEKEKLENVVTPGEKELGLEESLEELEELLNFEENLEESYSLEK